MSPMMLLDLEVDGQMRHAVAQPNKNGFFYMLDAGTGELLRGFPFTEVNWLPALIWKPVVQLKRLRHVTTVKISSTFLPVCRVVTAGTPMPGTQKTNLIYIATQRAYFAMQSVESSHQIQIPTATTWRSI